MQQTDRVMQVFLYLQSALVARTAISWNGNAASHNMLPRKSSGFETHFFIQVP